MRKSYICRHIMKIDSWRELGAIEIILFYFNKLYQLDPHSIEQYWG